MSMHYHKCPECLEKYNCDQDCTLRDAGNNLGVNIICPLCEGEDIPTPTTPEPPTIKEQPSTPPVPSMTPEDWDRYNGFTR